MIKADKRDSEGQVFEELSGLLTWCVCELLTEASGKCSGGGLTLPAGDKSDGQVVKTEPGHHI